MQWKDTVSTRMKRTDPKYPPNIVCNCDEASHCRYICMPENSSTVRTEASTNDVPLDTAEI